MTILTKNIASTFYEDVVNFFVKFCLCNAMYVILYACLFFTADEKKLIFGILITKQNKSIKFVHVIMNGVKSETLDLCHDKVRVGPRFSSTLCWCFLRTLFVIFTCQYKHIKALSMTV